MALSLHFSIAGSQLVTAVTSEQEERREEKKTSNSPQGLRIPKYIELLLSKPSTLLLFCSFLYEPKYNKESSSSHHTICKVKL